MLSGEELSRGPRKKGVGAWCSRDVLLLLAPGTPHSVTPFRSALSFGSESRPEGGTPSEEPLALLEV